MNHPDSVKLDGEFYLQVQNRLDHPDVVFSPAEIHGVATGLVCCGEDESTLVNWAPILTRELEDDASRTLVEDILSGLVALTQRALQSTDFTFQMLLPPDSSEITTRTAALADWCSGFCTGTAFNSRLNEADLEPDALEALTDIARIARSRTWYRFSGRAGKSAAGTGRISAGRDSVNIRSHSGQPIITERRSGNY